MGGVVSSVFGSGSQAGLLGTGQAHSDPYQINRSAFGPDANEQQLVGALQNQAYGKTPSLADMQMKQGLDQATSQAQAMAASQRGINPALAARLAAQSQAGMAQNANAQGAQLRAGEQQQGLSALTGELGSLRNSRQNAEALASGNANTAMNTNAQSYEGAANRRQGLMGGVGAALGLAHGGMVPQHLSLGGTVMGQQDQPPWFAPQAQAQPMTPPSGGPGSVGSMPALGPQTQVNSFASMPFGTSQKLGAGYAYGGPVQRMADGGSVMDPFFSQYLQQASQPAHLNIAPAPNMAGIFKAGKSAPSEQSDADALAGYKQADEILGTTTKNPGMMLPASSGNAELGALMAASRGGKVPGQAQVEGDSLKNDKVPAVLSPGEIVIPRSVVANGPDAAKKFVAAIIAKKGKSA